MADRSLARDYWLAALASAVWACILVWRGWNEFAGDLTPLYVASYLWAQDQQGLIYAAPDRFFGLSVDAWADVIAQIGLQGRLVYPYIYPPLWAALFAPLATGMSLGAFSNGALVVQAALLASLPLLAAKTLGRGHKSATVWVLVSLALMSLSIPVLSAIDLNQPSITIAFLILLAYERQGSGHPLAAGVLCALAACIKLTPALFAIYFLFRGDWRALSAFLVTCLTFLMLSLAVCGAPLHWAYLSAMKGASDVLFFSPMNQSGRSAVAAAWLLFQQGPALNAAGRDFSLPATLIPHVNLWMALAAFATLARLWQVTRRVPEQEARAVTLMSLSLILAIFGPIGWTHYYILPIALLPSFFRLSGALVAVAVALPLMLSQSMSVTQAVYAGQSARATLIYTLVTVCLWLLLLGAVLFRRKSQAITD